MWGIDIDELFVAHMKNAITPSAIATNINNCLTFDIIEYNAKLHSFKDYRHISSGLVIP